MKTPKKSKKQLTEEFLEKIKSIGINTGVKAEDTCVGCGKPLYDHNLVGIAVGGVLVPKRRKNNLNTGNEETAFAA